MNDKLDKALNRFGEYISWIDDLPNNTPKDHYKKVLEIIKNDLENILTN